MSITLGQVYEKQAAQYLIEQGLEFVASNIRYTFGEIDLVMRQGKTWVFVEVKYRRSGHYGGAIAAITKPKQLKLMRAVSAYVQQHKIKQDYRIDVIAIDNNDIHWLKNAITA